MTQEARPLDICVLGAASSVHVVARSKVFSEFGHNVTLVSPVDKSVEGLKVLGVDRTSGGGIWSKIVWLWRVFSLVRAARADIYHAHYAAEVTSWAGWLLGKRPLVVTIMGGDVLFDEQGSLGWLGRWLTRRTVLAADFVTVKSSLLRDVVLSFGKDARAVEKVLWGVDHRIFNPGSSTTNPMKLSWGISESNWILFSPRMLKPLFNQHLMVEALPSILATDPNALLVISTFEADPVYEARVRATADELGVGDHVKFVPALGPDEMSDAYNASDVVLSLPPSDGTPQSVMEAMACGTPVVISDLPRFHEIFTHGVNVMFTQLEPDSVAREVLALRNDAALTASLVESAKTLVHETAAFEREARRVEEIYYRMLPGEDAG